MSPEESRSLRGLELEVEEELTIARSSHAEEELDVSPAEWQFDPLDEVREEIGLQNLLDAAHALDDEP